MSDVIIYLQHLSGALVLPFTIARYQQANYPIKYGDQSL